MSRLTFKESVKEIQLIFAKIFLDLQTNAPIFVTILLDRQAHDLVGKVV